MSAGEERFVQAITLKLKAGPASPVLGTDNGGDSVVGGQHRGGGGKPNHGSVKWAPLSTTRRIGSGGEGSPVGPPGVSHGSKILNLDHGLLTARVPSVLQDPRTTISGSTASWFCCLLSIAVPSNVIPPSQVNSTTRTFTRTPHAHGHVR